MELSRKKLIVLDVNGLLVDTYFYQEPLPNEPPHAKVGNFFVYKRPFCGEFLQFCLQHFMVGIWSSAQGYNVNKLVNYVFGDLKEQLAFSWNQADCTDSGLKAPENEKKPLFLKELSKLWAKAKPSLPWREGDYDPSNTLLINDTPYKALRNPPNTGIFPRPYTARESGDDLLGYALRDYLKGLFHTESVQIYVERNPFGEPSITSESPYWNYLSKVIVTVDFVGTKVGDGIGQALKSLNAIVNNVEEKNDTQHLKDGQTNCSKGPVHTSQDVTESSNPKVGFGLLIFENKPDCGSMQPSKHVKPPYEEGLGSKKHRDFTFLNPDGNVNHDSLPNKSCVELCDQLESLDISKRAKKRRHNRESTVSTSTKDAQSDCKQTLEENNVRKRHMDGVNVRSKKGDSGHCTLKQLPAGENTGDGRSESRIRGASKEEGQSFGSRSKKHFGICVEFDEGSDFIQRSDHPKGQGGNLTPVSASKDEQRPFRRKHTRESHSKSRVRESSREDRFTEHSTKVSSKAEESVLRGEHTRIAPMLNNDKKG